MGAQLKTHDHTHTTTVNSTPSNPGYHNCNFPSTSASNFSLRVNRNAVLPVRPQPACKPAVRLWRSRLWLPCVTQKQPTEKQTLWPVHKKRHNPRGGKEWDWAGWRLNRPNQRKGNQATMPHRAL